jgi:hypothetical protein
VCRLSCVVAVAVLATGACSIGPQDAPVPVAPPATKSPTVQPSTGHEVPYPVTVQAYFLRGNRLVRLSRTVPRGSGLRPSLDALTEPLTTAELAEGLRTDLPTSPIELRGRLVAFGAAEVTVPPGFDRLSVRDQASAVAQLVFTITANTTAGSLRMVQDGDSVPVPDGTGEIVDGPVTREDYFQLRPDA